MSERDVPPQDSPHPRGFGDAFVDDVMGDVAAEAWLVKELSRTVPTSFDPSFEAVLMGRVYRTVAERHALLNGQVTDVLSRWFPRVAVPVAAVAVVAMIGNVSAVPADTSLIDALLGLHAADGFMLNILRRG